MWPKAFLFNKHDFPGGPWAGPRELLPLNWVAAEEIKFGYYNMDVYDIYFYFFTHNKVTVVKFPNSKLVYRHQLLMTGTVRQKSVDLSGSVVCEILLTWPMRGLGIFQGVKRGYICLYRVTRFQA